MKQKTVPLCVFNSNTEFFADFFTDILVDTNNRLLSRTFCFTVDTNGSCCRQCGTDCYFSLITESYKRKLKEINAQTLMHVDDDA